MFTRFDQLVALCRYRFIPPRLAIRFAAANETPNRGISLAVCLCLSSRPFGATRRNGMGASTRKSSNGQLKTSDGRKPVLTRTKNASRASRLRPSSAPRANNLRLTQSRENAGLRFSGSIALSNRSFENGLSRSLCPLSSHHVVTICARCPKSLLAVSALALPASILPAHQF